MKDGGQTIEVLFFRKLGALLFGYSVLAAVADAPELIISIWKALWFFLRD